MCWELVCGKRVVVALRTNSIVLMGFNNLTPRLHKRCVLRTH